MRLFGKLYSTIDRFDRAEWLTPPFDLYTRTYIHGADIDLTVGTGSLRATAGASSVSVSVGVSALTVGVRSPQ